MALREILPPHDTEPTTRRQARARRRRRNGPLAAGIVVVAAAATGSVAALMSAPDDPPVVAAYPSGSAASGRSAATNPADADPDVDADAVPLAEADPVGTGAAPSAGSAALRATRISQVPDRPPHAGPSWPALTYTLEAAIGAAEPPTFPGALQGFALQAGGRSTVTISQSRYFTAVGHLPVRTATYSACRTQRFYVRWMAVDPRAVVEATFVDEGVHTVQNRPVRGAAGWMSSYGCVQPALRIRTPAGANPAQAQVIVETQVWRRR